MIKYFYLFILTIVIFIFSIAIINRIEISPTKQEILQLNNFFGDLTIKDSLSLIKLQNKVIASVSHYEIPRDVINICNVIEQKKGSCYDRSLILQKICLLNGLKIRPVYIYFRNDGEPTRCYDIFKRKINSHSVFEYYYNDSWYLMRTNSKSIKLEKLEEYLQSGSIVPKHVLYIRHLSNRNGHFIYPSFLPDIY